MELREAIARVCARRDLTELEMAGAMGRIMDGEATSGQIGALLVGLRMKGETVAELVGAARAMRSRAVPLSGSSGFCDADHDSTGPIVPTGSTRSTESAGSTGPVVDVCGTGGDGAATINISTLAALVVAACGVRVAKHGNRAVSSRAGSADLLEALGVDIAAPAPVVERCLREVGIGFFFAPAWHGATRHAAPVRREIGVRTIFNLLGPLTNPAGVRHQLIGGYDGALVEPLARALAGLGVLRAMVVHGAGGLDEFAPAGLTVVAELDEGGRVTRRELCPRDFGLDDRDPAELAGGEPAENAALAQALLAGAPGAGRNAVVMSAAATLHIAGQGSLLDGARRAEEALDTGKAQAVLARLVAASRAGRPEAEAITSGRAARG